MTENERVIFMLDLHKQSENKSVRSALERELRKALKVTTSGPRRKQASKNRPK